MTNLNKIVLLLGISNSLPHCKTTNTNANINVEIEQEKVKIDFP